MAISDGLLGEFDHEMKTTRRMLERVPVGQAAWKPHQKSTSLGDLADHVSRIPGYAIPVLTQPELEARALAPEAGGALSREGLLNRFDTNVTRSRAALAAATDETMFVPWTFRLGDRVIFTLPRLAAYRSFVMSHLIHHRAQLGVYLRMNDVPLPGTYGPSADEPV
jgi:uncharacterized damage-inducible protein DinB